ncbi:MAG: HAD hydrolase-like protein [Deltaproteobacteria bacterium]|nr:HAD hydrolase-like protein [Deltaproteobacteria bacterium]
MSLWIFDLDGTLVDTSGEIVNTVNRFLGERGREAMDHGSVMQHVGYGTPHLMARVLGLALDDPAIPEATSRFVQMYASAPALHARTYPGVHETLEALRPTSTLAVVSNKAGPLVRATLEAFDLARRFTIVLGGGEFGALKPAADGILLVMGKSGTAPEETTMVGDMPLDMAAGRNAGVRTLFAAYGFGALEPGDPVPDGTLESFPEVIEWT